MSEVNVIRKVVVKSIVNDKLRSILDEEAQGNLSNLEQEFARFQQHREQYVNQCRERDVKPDYEIMKKMAFEEEKFKNSRAQVQGRLDEIKSLEDGQEYLHGTVDSTVPVKIGDNWHSLMTGVEVLLEDGVVKDIRERELKI